MLAFTRRSARTGFGDWRRGSARIGLRDVNHHWFGINGMPLITHWLTCAILIIATGVRFCPAEFEPVLELITGFIRGIRYDGGRGDTDAIKGIRRGKEGSIL